MTLYKYTSAEIGKKIIKNTSVALSRPSNFNDPFDCLPIHNEEEFKEATEHFYSYGVDLWLFDYLENLIKKVSNSKDRFVLGFFTFIMKFYKWAVGRGVAVPPVCTPSRINKFFSVYEKWHILTPEIREAKAKILTTVEKQREYECEPLKRLADIRKQMFTGCFSQTYDSILMWSHYASDHKGVCIEVELDEDPEHLFRVEYSEQRPQIETRKILAEVYKSMLQKNNPIKNDRLHSWIVQPYITKAREWSYEKEYRVIYTEEELQEHGVPKDVGKDGVERYFPKVLSIKRVFLGAAMPEKEKEGIRHLAQENEIPVIEMEISDVAYRLEHMEY